MFCQPRASFNHFWQEPCASAHLVQSVVTTSGLAEQATLAPACLQVLVTPHSAFLTKEALASIAATTVDNLKACALGQPLVNEVKP